MSPDDQATPAVPSLVESLKAYIDEIPEHEQADALHQVFYGFYTRVAIIDRSTHELAAWATNEAGTLEDVPDSLAEALRDNALFVGQELFAAENLALVAQQERQQVERLGLDRPDFAVAQQSVAGQVDHRPTHGQGVCPVTA